MGSSLSRDYIFGAGFGVIGAVISAPVYGAWPSAVRVLVVHPVVSVIVNHIGNHVSKRLSKPPKRPMWVEYPVQFSLPGLGAHWAAVSTLDLAAGTATPAQIAYTFVSGALMGCYAVGLEDVVRVPLQRFGVDAGAAAFTGLLCSTYLVFGFVVRHAVMRWNM